MISKQKYYGEYFGSHFDIMKMFLKNKQFFSNKLNIWGWFSLKYDIFNVE